MNDGCDIPCGECLAKNKECPKVLHTKDSAIDISKKKEEEK